MSSDPPDLDKRGLQSSWDDPWFKILHSNLLQVSEYPVGTVRLLSVSSPNAGAWLQALPSPSLGLHLPNGSFRIACGVRLGANVCEHHICPSCRSPVDKKGLHGLSCINSAGKKFSSFECRRPQNESHHIRRFTIC